MLSPVAIVIGGKQQSQAAVSSVRVIEKDQANEMNQATIREKDVWFNTRCVNSLSIDVVTDAVKGLSQGVFTPGVDARNDC
jgi:hypothetical protein